MERPVHDVVGLGNAIVDILADVGDAFLDEHGLTKGAMSLVDQHEAERLQALVTPRRLCSGGSAANTMVGIASFGGRAAFVGKIRDDAIGTLFRDDIRKAGVAFDTPSAKDGPGTGRCLVLVSADAQRTMRTFLGAAGALDTDDVERSREAIENARVTYLEGYLFDPEPAKRAFHRAAELAHAAGGEVALSLSDAFCVDRHRDEFRTLVREHVDILFANDVEIRSLYQTDDFDAAADAVADECDLAVLTRGADGAVVVEGRRRIEVAAARPTKLVDTTGAGDLFAAGFLYGHAHDEDVRGAAGLGALAASEIIAHYGARPERPLAELLREFRSAR